MMIGLTGGMGSGKTTAARVFHELGWELIDTDAICANLYTQGDPRIVEPLRRRWGEEVVDRDGAVNRGRVAEIVFADPKELSWLNATAHPVIQSEVERSLKEIRRTVIVETPLLFEAGWAGMFSSIIAIWAPRPIRFERLKARGWDDETIMKRDRTQLDAEEKLEQADVGLINAGPLAALERQCREVHDRWMKR